MNSSVEIIVMVWCLLLGKTPSFPSCFGRLRFLFVFCFPEKCVKGVCVSRFRHNYVGWASQRSSFIWKGDGRQLLKQCSFPFLSYLQNMFWHVGLFSLDPISSILRVFREVMLRHRFGGIREYSQNKVLPVLYGWCVSFASLAWLCWQIHSSAAGEIRRCGSWLQRC